jgi:MFS family permease
MKILERFALWLEEHAVAVGDSTKAIIVSIIAFIVSCVSICIFAANGWRGIEMEVLLGIFFLGGIFLPPLIEVIRTLITKTKWKPWYWFPTVIGCVIGCLLAMLIAAIFGWHG